MSKRQILGWYVISAKGERCAWAKTRQTARKLLDKLARDFPHEGPFWTEPELEG